MHIGRSHHTAVQAVISVIGGFAASFFVFAASTYVQLGGMRGQLVAGNQNVNRQYPSTLNAFQGAIDGTNPMMQSFTSYGFWLMVILGGIVASFILFKMARRYV